MGYKVYSKVLNAKDFGVPQDRERIYIVAFLDDVEFEFPESLNKNISIHNMFETKIDKKYYYNNKPLFSKIKDDVVDKNSIYQWRRKYVRENKSGICPTLRSNMGTGGHNVPIIKDDLGIRKLTPKECLNFQGFPKDFKTPNLADGQLYKQAGNSVVVAVIKEIAKSINSSFIKA